MNPGLEVISRKTVTDVDPSADPKASTLNCLSSPQQYGCPPERRPASSSVPPQTITPQSLQGKTVGVNSQTNTLLHSFSRRAFTGFLPQCTSPVSSGASEMLWHPTIFSYHFIITFVTTCYG